MAEVVPIEHARGKTAKEISSFIKEAGNDITRAVVVFMSSNGDVSVFLPQAMEVTQAVGMLTMAQQMLITPRLIKS